ncbi:MAG: serine protease, partial [Planctomycetota bacterium]|nr:serine protease [Planctomycetota bacterium]
MGQWLNVGVSLLVGLMCTTAVRADETAKKIQQAVKKIEGSVVGVRYSRDMSGLADITRERGGRGGNWLARIGRPRVTPGIIVNDKGFIVVPAEITRDPTRGWFGRQGGRSGSSGGSTLKELIVIMPDGSERKARLTGRDSRRGMAFIQLDDASGIKPVELAGKKDVSLADQVIVVAPLSDDNAETMRFLLTRINAIVGGERGSYSVMDDLSPYEGGIVMNMKGDVIGMVGRPPRGEG